MIRTAPVRIERGMSKPRASGDDPQSCGFETLKWM